MHKDFLSTLKKSYFDIEYTCAATNISLQYFQNEFDNNENFRNSVIKVKGLVRNMILKEVFEGGGSINAKLLPRLLDSELFKDTVYEKQSQKREETISFEKQDIIID